MARKLPEEVFFLPLLEQARRLAADEISSRELTLGYLDRIAAANPTLSAFVEVLEERVLQEARAADEWPAKKKRPPFLGVPMGIKDLNPCKGSFTRFGSRSFERLYTPFDCLTTAQLRRAGFVMIGKTATSEVGALPVTEPDIHPPTRNPWDTGVTPGGSSGGAASAVAAGLLPAAQGSDAGGSIRIPAALCNLYGFKPSRGRVPNSYGQDDRELIYTAGPITRTVDDAAALLDVMAGVTIGEPHWAPAPPAPFAELARKPPARLRVRVSTENPLCKTDPEIVAAVRRVADVVRALGHRVEDAAPIQADVAEFLPIWQKLTTTAPVTDWSLTQPVTRWLGEPGKKLDNAAILTMIGDLSTRILDWFGDADLWLTPTVAIAPPPIGHLNGMEPRDAFFKAARMGIFTVPYNMTGQPAASVPAGFSKAGHPIGVQLAGRRLADGVVLALSRQLEEAMPWSKARPAGFVAR